MISEYSKGFGFDEEGTVSAVPKINMVVGCDNEDVKKEILLKTKESNYNIIFVDKYIVVYKSQQTISDKYLLRFLEPVQRSDVFID